MQKNNVITIVLSEDDQNRLYMAWQENHTDKIPPYARWQLRPENCVITCYTSGKVVFQGSDAELYASPFQTSIKTVRTASPVKSVVSTTLPQAGSDEVGTGDYFGPVCVCASIVDTNTSSLIANAGARDSKALKDDDIRHIAAELIEVVPHSLLIVEPLKYNRVHEHTNMNAIKALCHNQAYLNLRKKYDLPDFCVIDQFAEEPIYYHYLKGQKEVVRNIHFETKAEDKYISVGISSVFARYAFLKYMDEMEKHYEMAFQKGGGAKADECAAAFVRKYGMEKLPLVAKMHFKNTERVRTLTKND